MQHQSTALKVTAVWLVLALAAGCIFAFYPGRDRSTSASRFAGLRYQKTLMNTISLITAHQFLSTRSTELSAKDSQNLISLQTSLDASLDQIDFLYNKSLPYDLPNEGKQDRVRASIANIKDLKNEWDDLKTQRPKLKLADVAERHRQLLKRLRVETARCAQLFELDKNLNPSDGELVRIVTQILPEVFELMGEIKTLPHNGALTESDRSIATQAIKTLEDVSQLKLTQFEEPMRAFILESKKLLASDGGRDFDKIRGRLFLSQRAVHDMQMKTLDGITKNLQLMFTMGQID